MITGIRRCGKSYFLQSIINELLEKGNVDYLNNPLEFGDIKFFNETLQQLSIMTFKNMQKFYNK